MEILEKNDTDQAWIAQYLTDLWGTTDIYLPSGTLDAAGLSAYYTEDRETVMTYHFSEQRAEIVTFNIPAGYPQDPVNEMIQILSNKVKAQRYDVIYATATNDHLDYMTYLQRGGFRFHKIHADAITRARLLNKDIPETGRYDIPMHDEIEFILKL